jgi:hypothetical protein
LGVPPKDVAHRIAASVFLGAMTAGSNFIVGRLTGLIKGDDDDA